MSTDWRIDQAAKALDLGGPQTYTFFVSGEFVTQGSKTPGVNRATGKAFMKESNAKGLQAWRHAINDEARKARGDDMPLTGPVEVVLYFWKQRPAAEPKRRRTWPIKARSGDADKLLRAVLDALTGVLFADDAQVIHCDVWKDWAGPPWHPEQSPGVAVFVAGLDPPTLATEVPA